MSDYKDTWLPKYRDMVPKAAHGFATCMYSMSLEAWRRGLDVTFKLKNKRRLFYGISYTVSNGVKTHHFDGSMGDISDPATIKICRNKGLTNEFLRKADVPTPLGRAFDEESDNAEIIEYALEIGFPLVIKPIDSGGGYGVVTNIQSKEEFEKHLINLRNKLGKKAVIAERFIKGEDYRILVLDGKVIGAYHRRALSVLGNGKDTIEVLLKKKVKERNASPFLKGKKIKVDQDMVNFLKEQNKDVNYIPKEGERVYLRRNGEYFGQRDSVNMTDKLNSEIKQIAIDAVNAIPGLKYGGVDMLINYEDNEFVVNEVNSKPQIGNHLFPMEGEAVDVPRIIFDYYFPETKYNETPYASYYYDFKPIRENFKSATASEIKLPRLPDKNAIIKEYIFIGENFNKKLFNKIKRESRGLSISGKLEVLSDNKFNLQISGTRENVEKLVTKIKEKKLRKDTNIEQIEEKIFNGPIKAGFEIINNQQN